MYVHCAERGELLDRVRRHYELEIQRLNCMIRNARERERKLHDDLRDTDHLAGAEVSASSVAVNAQVYAWAGLTHPRAWHGQILVACAYR